MIAAINIIHTVIALSPDFALSTKYPIRPAWYSGPSVLVISGIHLVRGWEVDVALLEKRKKILF